MEPVSFWTLDVTVVRARTKTRQDYFSKSDLYVTLSLPTGTAITHKTRTVSNSQQPEWNETFRFRVPSSTKNVLELSVLDEDTFTSDDLVYKVLLDLETVEVDSKVRRELVLDQENEDVLELELELRSSDQEPVLYPSNGIVLAPPMSAVDVSVEKLEHNHFLKRGCTPMLRLSGAFEEHLEIREEKLQFHVNRDLEAELELTKVKVESEPKEKKEESLSSVTLKPLLPQLSQNISLTLDKDTVDLHLEAQEVPSEQLAVRLDSDVPPQEKEFLQKRRRIVAKALQTLLELDSPPSEEQVPVVAVVGSGGGSRACTATLGALRGLKELGVLDTVTYITAVSGATWGLSRVSQDEDWSQNLDPILSQVKEHLTKDLKSALTVHKRREYHNEVKKKKEEGHLVSLDDMAGLVYEHLVFGEKDSGTLSDQQRAVQSGQNPFPIYTAVNIKAADGYQTQGEWVEFTPFEVGLPKYGAFVRAEDFGSEFFLGHLIKKLPEIRLPFLMGIWGSAFSASRKTIWKQLIGFESMFADVENIIHRIVENSGPSALDTIVIKPDSGLSSVLSRFFQDRPILNETRNFTRGLSLHQNYSLSSNFLASEGSYPDAFPNQLTPSEPTLRLLDSGLAINIACPSVLRPERLADVIIILNNGWDPDNPFEVLEKTDEFCEEHNIPFPKVDYAELKLHKPFREIYMFEDLETPKAPIVLHLPLVNASFRENKAPGVPRETPEELAEGQVDVSSEDSPYTTDKLTFSPKDYDALINLTTYNVQNNRDTIVSAIRRALSRK